MVVNDGIIEKMFMEQPRVQNSQADPFEVSDVDTMMAYLQTKTEL
jgi:peroxiredoxin